MIYLYAYTNHKEDLDSLRRMGALWKLLAAKGIEAELLVNDYRAQLAARELGLPLATTIETVRDIDAVADYGDKVVIDTPEAIPPSLLTHYLEHFDRVFRIVPGGADPLAGEKVIDPFDRSNLLVDPDYLKRRQASERRGRILIYRDSDPQKWLVQQGPLLRDLGLELYWGSYFYVKYEELLAQYFSAIRESEEYPDLIKAAALIVTAMPQTALEATVAGARTIYWDREGRSRHLYKSLQKAGVEIHPVPDPEALKALVEGEVEAEQTLEYKLFDADLISE